MAERTFYISGSTGSTVLYVGPARIISFSSLTQPTNGSFSLYDSDNASDTSRQIGRYEAPAIGGAMSPRLVNIPVYRGILVVESGLSNSGRGVTLVYEDDPVLDGADRGYGANVIQ